MQDKSVISIDSSLVARGRIAPAPYQLMLRISTEGKSEHAPSVRPQKRKERESGPLTKFTVPWISTYPHRFSCNSTADVRDQETDRHTVRHVYNGNSGNSSPLYICGKEKVCCTHEECRRSAHRPSLGREPSQLQGTTTINSFNWYRIILLGDNKLRITCPTLLPDSDG